MGFFSFHGIEKLDEDSKEVFSKKMKLDLLMYVQDFQPRSAALKGLERLEKIPGNI